MLAASREVPRGLLHAPCRGHRIGRGFERKQRGIIEELRDELAELIVHDRGGFVRQLGRSERRRGERRVRWIEVREDPLDRALRVVGAMSFQMSKRSRGGGSRSRTAVAGARATRISRHRA